MFDIGSRIIYFRNLHNISANKLSKELKVDPSTINKIEKSTAKPSMDLLFKICEYFQVTPAEFFTVSQEQDPLLSEIHQIIDKMDIASKIIALRETAGWSKNKLAKESGISQAYVSQLESGQKLPGIDVLSRICTALGITLAEFFAETQEQQPIPPEVHRVCKRVKRLPLDKVKVLESVLDSWVD